MKRNILIAAVTAAALIGGGTATALATTGDDERTGPRTPPAKARPQAQAQAQARQEPSVADVVAAALREVPGTAVSADRDDDRRGGAWEVEVLSGDGTWHSVRIDPATGGVLGSERDDEDDTAEVRAALKDTSVTAAEAARAVSGHGTVASVELDDDGTPAWEVGTRAGGGGERDWRVDPDTGRVTADRADDGDHADDADDAERTDDGDRARDADDRDDTDDARRSGSDRDDD